MLAQIVRGDASTAARACLVNCCIYACVNGQDCAIHIRDGMVAKGDRRRGNKKNNRNKLDTRASASSDEEDSGEEHKAEGPPPKFMLAGDNTGSGIDYNVLDKNSWQILEDYCKV